MSEKAWIITVDTIHSIQEKLLHDGYVSIGYGDEFRDYDPSTDNAEELMKDYREEDHDSVSNMLKIKPNDIIVLVKPEGKDIQICICDGPAVGVAQEFPDSIYTDYNIGLCMKVRPFLTHTDDWINHDEINSERVMWAYHLHKVDPFDEILPSIKKWRKEH